MRWSTTVVATPAAILSLALLAGCGGEGSTTVTEAQTTTVFLPSDGAPTGGAATGAGAAGGGASAADTGAGAAGGSGKSIEIQMGDFYFKPSDSTAPAGSVEISAPNVGAAPHELVLASTDLDPAKLPTLPNGEVDEEQLDSPGEISEVAAGATGTATIDLKPGPYAIFCNIPDHYAQGMYGSLTVAGG